MKKHIGSRILRLITWMCAGLAAGIFLFIVLYILIRGIPHVAAAQFAWKHTTENQSMLPALINTVLMTALTLLIAAPLGIGSAVYLTEYARRGNRLVRVIRLAAETLSGIPSILFGLFGFLMFNINLKWGYSFLSGALTMAAMVLPVILRTAEEALLSVPQAYREAAYGLGAGKLRVVFRVALPAALPGVLSGLILSVGRITGESAALIFTSGTAAKTIDGLFSSGRTLAAHMYCLLSEGLYTDQAYATGVVLLALVLLINYASSCIVRRLNKRRQA